MQSSSHDLKKSRVIQHFNLHFCCLLCKVMASDLTEMLNDYAVYEIKMHDSLLNINTRV